MSDMGAEGSGDRIAPSRHRLLKAMALAFLALKLGYLCSSGVFMDDAYYWLWGQHLALSYYDHPSMIGWTQGLSGLLFGWNGFALRFMLLVSTAMDIALLYLFARRLAPGDWQANFWPTLVLFLGTPLFFAVTGFAVPDHWLVTFTLLASYGFTSFFLSVEAGTPRYRLLYLGALGLGLGILSKYNAAFLGVGIVLFAILTPRFRPLFRDRHTYLAALLVLAIQTPVIVWNLSSNFASFGFILGGRHAGLTGNFALSGFWGFLGSQLAFLGPFLLMALARLVFWGRHDTASRMGWTIFLVSTPIILLVSVFTDVLFHWNLVAYTAVLPFLAPYLRPAWLRVLHWIYGLAFAGLMIFNYAVAPVMALISYTDQSTSWTYGWDATAAYVKKAEAKYKTSFIASTAYEPSAALAWALQDPDVTSLAAKREEFDYWFDRPAHAGQAAIVVAVSWRPLGQDIKTQFRKMTKLTTLKTRILGKIVDLHDVYLAEGFKP